MAVKELKFKTNINCGGCIASVTPHLNKAENIAEWQVDLENPDKILTVRGKELTPEQVKEIVEQAGFKIEQTA